MNKVTNKKVAESGQLVVLTAVFLASCATGPIITKGGADTESVGHYSIPTALLSLTVQLKYPSAALTDASQLKPGVVSMSVTSIEVLLVPAAHIPIHFKGSIYSTDNVTIDVNEKGFLTQVAVDVDDQSGDFFNKLTDIVGAGVKAAAVYPATILSIDSTSKEVTQDINVVLDPYSTGDTIDPILGITGDEITLSIVNQGVATTPTNTSLATDIVAKCSGTICYPVLVSKSIKLSGPAGTEDQKIVIIPDPGNLVIIDLERAAAVKKTVTADFTNGMLTKLVLDKPSEALAVANIPFNILTKIIALPSELIQLKIDTSTNEKDLLEAQKALIEAQQSLIEAVEKAKADLAAGGEGTGSFGDP